jgi:hypothetical protein
MKAQGWRVRFYEDYPYATNEGALSAALVARGITHWQPMVTPLSQDDLVAKVQAIACYESQLGVLFGSVESMALLVRGYISRLGGERLWWPDHLYIR